MAKVRRKKKPAIYHNNTKDPWTNDTKEQLSLALGSDGYEARQVKLAENTPMSEENLDQAVEEQFEMIKASESEASELAEELHEAFKIGHKSPAVMQYLSMVQRQDVVRKTAKIASNGLGRTITEKEIESATRGITVLPDDVPKVLQNYETELLEREIPVTDTNHDGQIDEDDIYMSPGMRRMRRYI